MRKQFLFIFLGLIVAHTTQAQTRSTKVGYIDMEYILQNVPEYTEAQNQLEQKAQQWKQEIETKKSEINKLKEALSAEKALLTKGLIEERVAEITFLENENLEYQQKRFGPYGDLMTQKAALTKPIQDQVFTAIQDIAESKKYDFIFDKTSDMTMIFAAKRFDISDQIVRVLNRTEKREQLTKKQLKEEEAKEAREEELLDNPALANKQKALDERNAKREEVIANRALLLEERKKAAEDKRLQIIADRDARKTAAVSSGSRKATTSNTTSDKVDGATTAAEARQKQTEERARILEERKQAVEDRKKEAEDRRLQIIADREAKKTGATPTPAVSNKTASPTTIIEETPKAVPNSTNTAAEVKQTQQEARAKILEERKKIAEDNKKAQEEKRKQLIEAKKTGTVSESTTKQIAKPAEIKNTTEKIISETNATAKDTTIKTPAELAKQKQADARAKALEERNKILEDRKKEVEERRKKILEEREAAKKK